MIASKSQGPFHVETSHLIRRGSRAKEQPPRQRGRSKPTSTMHNEKTMSVMSVTKRVSSKLSSLGAEYNADLSWHPYKVGLWMG